MTSTEVLGVVGFSVSFSPPHAARLAALVDAGLVALARQNGGRRVDLPADVAAAVMQLRVCARQADAGATLSAAVPRSSGAGANGVAEVPEVGRQQVWGTEVGTGAAAGHWGVSTRHVRSRADSGLLPARKNRGGAWLLDAGFVRRFRRIEDAVAAHVAHLEESQDIAA